MIAGSRLERDRGRGARAEHPATAATFRPSLCAPMPTPRIRPGRFSKIRLRNAGRPSPAEWPGSGCPDRDPTYGFDQMGYFSRLVLIALAVSLLASCYERRITRSVGGDPGWLKPPDRERYGMLRVYVVKEYRKPWRIFQFPDGGKPFELAQYFEFRQLLPGGEERVVGRAALRPVRRGDFGNIMLGGGHEWLAPDRLRYWIRHGYFGSLARTDTTELVIPPLP